MFQKYIKEYQRSYLWHAPFATVYNVTRADDLQQLLKNSDCLVRGKVYAFGLPFLGNGILLSEGKKWQTSRKVVGQFFHHSFQKNSKAPLELETDMFIEKLTSFNGAKVNLQKELSEYILNTFCKVVLGAEFDSTLYLNIMLNVETLLAARLGKLLMYIEFVYNWFGDGREFLNISRKARKVTSDMVRERKAEGNTEPNGLLDHLLKSELDEQSVCDEIDNLILAGYDTTATTLSFILFQLALDAECQQKAYLEIRSQDPIDYNSMEYLDCVIKEGLRLYPGVPKLHRTLTRTVQCGNLIFTKGTEVSINLFDIHRDPKYFPEPDTFQPERFFAVDLGDRNPYVYVPFSFGTRNCLGRKFAVLEMKIVLSKIIRNFQIIPVSRQEDVKFKTGFLLRSWENLYVKFVKRE